MENMTIYEAGRSVPQEAQKPFSNGSFSGTDINPMWRIKKLTELFGAAGIGWYTEVISERAETYGETVMAIVDINLYIKVDGEWSKPIFGTGGNLLVQATKSGTRPSDEGYKKAYTDALSIACKALGIGADIWYDRDPTSKYAAQYTDTKATPVERAKPEQRPEPRQAKPATITVTPMCEICHKPIMGVTKSSGEVILASDIVEKTKAESGKAQCLDCFRSWKRVQAG